MIDIYKYKSNKEKKNYSLQKEITLSCINCDAALATIIVVKDTNDEDSFKALCPFCDGKSFVKKIKGKVYISHAEGVKMGSFCKESGVHIIRLMK